MVAWGHGHETFHGSSHRVYFDACSCYAPTASLQPK
jgi:hypothetical protein